MVELLELAKDLGVVVEVAAQAVEDNSPDQYVDKEESNLEQCARALAFAKDLIAFGRVDFNDLLAEVQGLQCFISGVTLWIAQPGRDDAACARAGSHIKQVLHVNDFRPPFVRWDVITHDPAILVSVLFDVLDALRWDQASNATAVDGQNVVILVILRQSS